MTSGCEARSASSSRVRSQEAAKSARICATPIGRGDVSTIAALELELELVLELELELELVLELELELEVEGAT